MGNGTEECADDGAEWREQEDYVSRAFWIDWRRSAVLGALATQMLVFPSAWLLLGPTASDLQLLLINPSTVIIVHHYYVVTPPLLPYINGAQLFSPPGQDLAFKSHAGPGSLLGMASCSNRFLYQEGYCYQSVRDRIESSIETSRNGQINYCWIHRSVCRPAYINPVVARMGATPKTRLT